MAWRRLHYAEYNKRVKTKRRLTILAYYSNGDIKCECCEERFLEFLSIDHINGGGTAQRRLLGTRDTYVILQKIKNDTGQYPEGFRVLCHNCNQSYGFYGYCPHKNMKDKLFELSKYKGEIVIKAKSPDGSFLVIKLKEDSEDGKNLIGSKLVLALNSDVKDLILIGGKE